MFLAGPTVAPLDWSIGRRVDSRVRDAGFAILFCGVIWAGLAHHAFWRDEMQAWQIAVAARSPFDLFHRLRYEGHPGLWHLLLWLPARLTHAPVAMKLVQGAVAAAYVCVLWLASPFRAHEKLLLSLNYFVLFEHAVISRSYGLGLLLAFAFAWARDRAVTAGSRRAGMLAWGALGLLANTTFYVAVLAIACGGFWLLEERAVWRRHRPGLQLFVPLLLVAIATMAPAPDTAKPFVVEADWSRTRILEADSFLVRALAPFQFHLSAVRWESLASPVIIHWPTVTALLLALLVASFRRRLGLLLPVAAVALVVAVFSAGFYEAYTRHIGVILVAVVVMAWQARRSARLDGRAFAVLLALGALGGVQMTLATWSRPFSNAVEVADWLRARHLDQGFVAAMPDQFGAVVAGYLDRPIYYPDDAAASTYIEWTRERLARASLDVMDHGRSARDRIAAAMAAAHQRSGVLIYLNNHVLPRWPFPPSDAPLTATPLATFAQPSESGEDYTLFRLDLDEGSS